jgi:protein TonB
MSIEPGLSPQNDFGTLQGCFVEGNPEQRKRERRIRRRALIISVAAQAAIVTAIILVPLFGKPESIAHASVMPLPPYFHHSAPQRQPIPQPIQQPDRHLCATCYSPTAPDRPVPAGDPPTQGDPIPGTPTGGDGNTQVPWGIAIDDGRRQPERPADVRPQRPQRVMVGHLEPAMLVHRVEPEYPALAKQIHREGQVEIRAVIATDGTIQSLQVVSGDPLFLRSATDAVSQWRYRATVLNGQPVEIETYITVIYTLQH